MTDNGHSGVVGTFAGLLTAVGLFDGVESVFLKLVIAFAVAGASALGYRAGCYLFDRLMARVGRLP